MTIVRVKLPDCNYFETCYPEAVTLWKEWLGRFIKIDKVKDSNLIGFGSICDTDVGFQIVEPEFIEQYNSRVKILSDDTELFICRHMIEAGD